MTITIEEARSYGWGDRAAEFVAWRTEMDKYVEQLLGLSTDDLPDWDFATAFESGMSAKDAAFAFAEMQVSEYGLSLEDFE